MKIGVCGIVCEKCPRMTKGTCPNGSVGCTPRENKFCKICTCAFKKGIKLCFECADFPCELTKQGPISFGYCQYISGKEKNMKNNIEKLTIERQNFSRNLFVSLAHFHSLCDIKQEQLVIARLKQDDNAVKDIIEQRQIYVISGILCAVSFLEANINEILDAAKTYIYLTEARPKLVIFKKCEISVIENLAAFKDNLSRKLGTLEKYQYALMISSKKPFDKGKAPYQDVDLIFDLRNLLVHYEPEWIESFAEGNSIKKDMQKIEKKLRGKFDLSKSIDEMKPFFPDRCLCYGCIDWVVKSIMIFGDDFFKKMNLVPDFKPSSIININKKGKIK